MHYLLIGNSAAAVGTVEGIRQVDKAGAITIVTDEAYHTYSRPLISYLLYGKVTEEGMNYRPADFYKDNGCALLTGKKVTKIDPKAQRVLLDSGDSLPYDKLLVATGSRPFVPPMEGLDRVKNKFSFMTLDDAKAVKAVINENSRVLIVGAGLIGLKAAEGLNGKVGEIAVVDLADRVLPSILDETGSGIVKKHIESKGVRFYLSDSVACFDENAAHLKSGGCIEFDVLIVAVGVRPNTELVSEAGGEVHKGIVTDANQETTLPGVYAAGDCCESHDITVDQDRVLALLPNAYMQGEAAGINMAGGSKQFDKAIPMNAIGFFGLHMITAGSYDGKEYVQEQDGAYKKLVFKDGLMKGYILIGEIARAGIYTSMIKERIPVEDVDFELLLERPQLMMFSEAARAEKLGGHRHEN